MRIIPSNSSTAALRRISFTLVDATDLFTPEDITVTGVKVSLNINGGTPGDSTNDIVKVAGSTGEYYLELTQSEANQTAGALIRGTLQPSGCALSKLQCQIGPSGVFAATVDANVTQIAGQTANAAAAVTFPATVASTTNITGGTITTVTNLTNAPGAGDFTATMKTSIGTAVAASAVASVTGNVGGNVTGSVGSLAAGAITNATTASAAALTAAGITAANGVTKIAGQSLVVGGTAPTSPIGKV